MTSIKQEDVAETHQTWLQYPMTREMIRELGIVRESLVKSIVFGACPKNDQEERALLHFAACLRNTDQIINLVTNPTIFAKRLSERTNQPIIPNK